MTRRARSGPLFERGFVSTSFANRLGYGTHAAVACYEGFRDRSPWVLRGDIYRYFPAIDHALLKADLRRRIDCEGTLWLMDLIIDASNAQEPVERYFPGDDLFTPWQRRRGLPLGNLTSQFFANVYLDRFDHWCTEVLGGRGYLRYVDDFAWFAGSRQSAEEAKGRMADFLSRRRLLLHPVKTRILPCSEPALFLGYELAPGGRRRLDPANVSRFVGRLQTLRARWRQGTVDEMEVRQRVGSWIAHARHAQTWRLRHQLLKDGWFDPARRDEPG